MCTISFIPNPQGFYLGMNRDELLLRAVALPPEMHRTESRTSVYPREPSGGTWIGVNDLGLCLALINWHLIPAQREIRVISRGLVVKALLAAENIAQSYSALAALPLRQMPPFRLVAIASRDRSLAEFRWNQHQLRVIKPLWTAQHWFSSGFDEAMVQAKRAEICQDEWQKSDAGSLPWLRRLHQSHLPQPSVLSICMHSENAATVSYTEIVLETGLAVMRYHQGSSCKHSGELVQQSIRVGFSGGSSASMLIQRP
jgi:hypothetical protein